MNGLSLCVIYRDEEALLTDFLRHHLGLFEETVFVDTGSSDGSNRILAEHGIRPHLFPWCDDFSAARNHSLNLATQPFIIVLDIDERLLPEDADRLRRLIDTSGLDGFSLRQINFCDDPAAPGWHSGADLPVPFRPLAAGYIVSPLIRVFRNHPAVRFRGAIHEVVGDALHEAGMHSTITDIPIYHFGWVKGRRDEGEKQEKKRRYRAMIRRAWEAAPSPQTAYYYLASLEDPAEKLEQAYRFARQYPLVKEFSTELARAAARLRQWERALAYIERGLQRFPDHQPLLALQVTACNECGRAEAALALAERLQAADPGHPLYLYERLRALLLLGRKAEVREALPHLPDTFPVELRSALQRLAEAGAGDGNPL